MNKIKPKKRNGFWTFWFSFVPGCAEMYWGFMQAGVSLLIPFVSLVFLAYLLNMEELMFLDAIVYLYAFFHARNMAHMTEEEVGLVEDGGVNLLDGIGVSVQTLRKRFVAKAAGMFLIIFGVYEVMWAFYRSVPFPDWLNRYVRNALHGFPQMATATLLIVLGVKLIMGKKQELDRAFEKEAAGIEGTEKTKEIAETGRTAETERIAEAGRSAETGNAGETEENAETEKTAETAETAVEPDGVTGGKTAEENLLKTSEQEAQHE
ncbi:MAG: hypothetical protein J6M66_09860 [Lachnospiraceae bacterium]|nr:hypothetical protein [Lachnospiraceae bacterium]